MKVSSPNILVMDCWRILATRPRMKMMHRVQCGQDWRLFRRYALRSFLPNSQPLTPSPQAEAEAERDFLKAIEIARKQQAKSLELRAVMSLVRLRRHQAQDHES